MRHESQLSLELYTSSEAAKAIGVSPVTVKMSRCTGKLLGKPAPKFLKMGRLIRYEPSAIQDWIKQFRSFSTTEDARNEWL